MMWGRALFAALVGALLHMTSSAAQSVPEGFEFLSEPQIAFVDLYFGGANIGGAMASFTPDSVSFDDPAALADMLPSLTDKAAVAAALTGPLPTNADQICFLPDDPDCGRLAPQIAGVIFDGGTFRADLFVNATYLEASTLDDVRFLPPGGEDFAVRADLFGSVSGSRGDATSDTTYQAMTKLIAAKGNQRLEVIGGIASQMKGEIDRLALVQEQEGTRYEGGYIRTSGNALVPEIETYGARIESTTDLRLDLEQTSATPIILFIERRSRVEILRDGRLLSTRIYDAGNQELDVSALPDGAYDIDIRVFEGVQLVQQQTQLFVKSRRFPPRDTTMFVVEAGVLPRQQTDDTLPDATSNFFAHAGLSHRIADNIALNGDVYGSEHVGSLGANLIYLARNLNVEADALIGTDRSWASRLRLNYSRPGFNTSLDALWAEDGTYACQTLDQVFDPVTQDERELIWNMSFNVGQVRVGSRVEHREAKLNGVVTRDTFFLPTLDWSYQPNANRTLSAALSGRFGEGERTVFLRLTLRERDGKWTYSGANRSALTDTENRLFDSNEVEAVWRDGLLYDDDIEASLGLRRGSTIESTLFGRGSYIGRRAQADLEFDHGISGNHVTSYSGSARSGLTFTGGALSFAGRRQSGSAIVIDLTGDAVGTPLEISINGRSYGTATVGTRTPIFLPPYDLYRVELAIEGGSNIRFDGKAQQSPLYPGNVITMSWDVHKVVPLFGQLVDGTGNPVANHRVEAGESQDYSDAYGYFVIDVSAADTQLTVSKRGAEQCAIDLPALDFDQDLISLDTLVCSNK